MSTITDVNKLAKDYEDVNKKSVLAFREFIPKHTTFEYKGVSIARTDSQLIINFIGGSVTVDENCIWTNPNEELIRKDNLYSLVNVFLLQGVDKLKPHVDYFLNGLEKAINKMEDFQKLVKVRFDRFSPESSNKKYDNIEDLALSYSRGFNTKLSESVKDVDGLDIDHKFKVQNMSYKIRFSNREGINEFEATDRKGNVLYTILQNQNKTEWLIKFGEKYRALFRDRDYYFSEIVNGLAPNLKNKKLTNEVISMTHELYGILKNRFSEEIKSSYSKFDS